MYEDAHGGKEVGRGGGGRVSSYAVLFSRQSYHSQVMKSFADSGMGEVIMGKREAA